MADRRRAGIALVVTAAVSFGALGVLARTAYDDGATPLAVLTCRFGLAGAVFVVIRLVRRGPLPDRRTLAGLVLMGLAYVAESLCYFLALDHAPPGLVALLLYTFPVIVVVGSVVLLHERLTRRLVAACAVAVVGTGVVIGPSLGTGDRLGLVYGLGSAACYSAYILLGTTVLPGTDGVTASAVVMATAGLTFAVLSVAAPDRPRFPATATGWAAVVAIAGLCTVLAVSAFLAGLARTGPATASTVSTLEPVASVLASAVVLGERVTVWTGVGGVLVLGAVIAVGRARATESPADASTATA